MSWLDLKCPFECKKKQLKLQILTNFELIFLQYIYNRGKILKLLEIVNVWIIIAIMIIYFIFFFIYIISYKLKKKLLYY